MTPHDRMAQIIRALAWARFIAPNEARLQEQVAFALKSDGIVAAREFVLSQRDRPDFFVPTDGADGIAVELKVQCDAKELLRQVGRYAEHARVVGIVAAAVSHHVLQLPATIGGKPLVSIQLRSF